LGKSAGNRKYGSKKTRQTGPVGVACKNKTKRKGTYPPGRKKQKAS